MTMSILSSRLFTPSLQRNVQSKVTFSSQSKVVFDRVLKQRQRQYVLQHLPHDTATYYDYLREESARRLLDRLDDITKSFPVCLELGAFRSHIYDHIVESIRDTKTGDNPHYKGAIGGIETLIQCDMNTWKPNKKLDFDEKQAFLSFERLICDEEFLPFPEQSFDLVLSNMSMHWINDLPQALNQIQQVLKPDGAFLATMLGGNTLKELRHCFYLAELERKGGMSAHTSPLTLASDIAGLMQAANFSLPTVDVDTIQVKCFCL